MPDTIITPVLILSALLAWLVLAMVVARVLGRVAATGDRREHVHPLRYDAGTRPASAPAAIAPVTSRVRPASVPLH